MCVVCCEVIRNSVLGHGGVDVHASVFYIHCSFLFSKNYVELLQPYTEEAGEVN